MEIVKVKINNSHSQYPTRLSSVVNISNNLTMPKHKHNHLMSMVSAYSHDLRLCQLKVQYKPWTHSLLTHISLTNRKSFKNLRRLILIHWAPRMLQTNNIYLIIQIAFALYKNITQLTFTLLNY